MSGHGPQENWTEDKRKPFFINLEIEIEKARNAGAEFIVQIDSNSKLGNKYIEGDPHPISPNGKILSDIIDRQKLIVINWSNKSKGLITRIRKTENKTNKQGRIERSLIDLVITSEDIFSKTIKMEVFEDRKNVLHRKIKTKKWY